MPLYDFKCSVCSKGFELSVKLADYDSDQYCPDCNNLATRLVSAPNVYLEGISGDFPGAALSWERKRKQKLDQERKRDS